MGNAESNVTSGVKNQAGVCNQAMYKLVDLKGGGLLVDMMKRAAQNKQYAELDHAIKTKVEPFLYNKGKGRLIPVRLLVLLRNKERGKHKWVRALKVRQVFSRKGPARSEIFKAKRLLSCVRDVKMCTIKSIRNEKTYNFHSDKSLIYHTVEKLYGFEKLETSKTFATDSTQYIPVKY